MKHIAYFRLGIGLALGLLLGSTAGHAQAVLSSDSVGWYVGAQAGLQHPMYNSTQYGGVGLLTLTAAAHGGYQLRPRLAVQAGLRYGHGSTPQEVVNGIGSFRNYPETEYINGVWTVPVQVRWAFTKTPRRFRLEGLVGANVSFFTLRHIPGRPEAAPRQVIDEKGVNGFIDFGLGSRLHLSSRLDLATDLLLNFNLQRPANSYLPVALGYGLALGLNYRLP